MLASGFGRAFMVIPRVIFINNSNPNSDRFALSIWQVLTRLGDVIAVLGISFLILKGVQWNYALMAFMILLLFIGVLQQFFVDEI